MSNTTLDQLAKLEEALNVLQKMDPKGFVRIQGWRVFLAVTATPGITQSTLEDQVGVSQSAVSRHVLGLGRHGLELLESEENPQNLRMKLYNLTNKGKRVAEKLASILEN